MKQRLLRLPALAIRQDPDRQLFSFAIDGKRLSEVAAISRVQRDASQQLQGYQRAESFAHIKQIRQYLETTGAILPNALVVAFDERVQFKKTGDSSEDGITTEIGHLIVPVVDGQDDAAKPGWVVDGQQRSAAIRDADVDSFPVYVVAFI